MIPVYHIPERPPDAPGRRKFRIAVAIIALIVIVALVLQSTSHALLPGRKTSSLWGILTGIALMTAYVEWRWTRAVNRNSR